MWGRAENISELLILSKLEPNNMYFVFKFKVHQYPFSCLNRCLLSIYSLCEVFTSKAVQISPPGAVAGVEEAMVPGDGMAEAERML